MKITVWTLASDTDSGTSADVFATEHEAYTAYFDAIIFDDDHEKAKAALDAKDYATLCELGSAALEGTLDTLSVDFQTLEITIPPAPPATDERKEDGLSDLNYILRARIEYQREGEIEIDDNAIVSRGDDNGAYVAAWVWVQNEEPDEPFTCQGCGREESICSADPCPGVIADREGL